jgi:hypothetical protein
MLGGRARGRRAVDRSGPVGCGEGVIEQFELDDGEEPVPWLHGRYRSVGDLAGQG